MTQLVQRNSIVQETADQHASNTTSAACEQMKRERMKILMVHGRYAQHGGEDEVFEAESLLLRERGHLVTEYVRENAVLLERNILQAGARALWSQEHYHLIRKSIRESGSELVAVHNFFPLISPAVYYAACAEGVPVVQTLHNYRLICPSATMLRDEKLCSDCVGKTVPLPAIVHACYRSSRVLSAGVVAMLAVHKLMRTWDGMVTQYVALTQFMKDRYVEGGFSPDKIVVKPNFTHDTAVGRGGGNFFLFVGRLSLEKGLSTLLKAWALARPSCELRILGSGPEEFNLRAQAAGMPEVHFLGQQSKERVLEEMGCAMAVIVPSIWHEAFGLTIIEAFAKGTPVLATDLEGMSSLVTPGSSGFLFPRGDAQGLARLLGERDSLARMRPSARAEYERRFTPAINYEMIEGIYRSVLRVHPDVGAYSTSLC